MVRFKVGKKWYYELKGGRESVGCVCDCDCDRHRDLVIIVVLRHWLAVVARGGGKAMAYRRRHGISRASTFKEEIRHHADDENGSPTSSSPLAVQAIKASAARRDPSLHLAFPKYEHDHHRSKCIDSSYMITLFKYFSHCYDASSQEGIESKASGRGSPTKPKGISLSNSKSQLAPSTWNPWQQPAQTGDPQAIHATQLKASRDVAMATAAKAKLLLRELKTVKADLAFSKARCAQLEEENKMLRDREGSEKGQTVIRADDDLIRLQLETLLAEKGRLASENEVYARENRFLREIVEYHQLSMQDVVYLDEGMEEVAELYPIDTTCISSPGVPRVEFPMSPRSPLNPGSQKKSIFSVSPQQQRQRQEEDEAEDNKNIASELNEHAVTN
ncbi:hypothetical protein LR48_Vigan11g175000 [Vigna angularis]|uniref:Uncharacterized protein n=1 Tax=Phaseolus angularis TaxID=3914 RepID=A0A0L9VUE7_PHAAN|nr:hypothetical protein LR48_Vigan11g175000 [Vigna angularis]